ncbi:MAG TPA: alpha/beta fold hydrolase, partial [Casimicrobiaceae bacterium]|nr:alpha/beta fold hydrolase [Casimicrobiaceae bacterium]
RTAVARACGIGLSLALKRGEVVDVETPHGVARVHLQPVDGPRGALVLGHGAGAPQTHPFMVAAARALAERGIDVVTFNFVYMEHERGAPDRNDRLEACFAAVVADARALFPSHALAAGGKSMGGRIASQAAAKQLLGDLRALVFLGYPLHPPKQPEKLRDKHLPSVRAPMLFIQGERDPFGTPNELAPIIQSLNAKLLAIPRADHSLKTPKTQADPLPAIYDAIARFVRDAGAGA